MTKPDNDNDLIYNHDVDRYDNDDWDAWDYDDASSDKWPLGDWTGTDLLIVCLVIGLLIRFAL